jgi:hypothetical protein
MPSATTWRQDDAAEFVELLNAEASTFAGFSFDGWHLRGASFEPPEVEAGNKVAFGRVGTGQANTIRCFRPALPPAPTDEQINVAPTRNGLMQLELFISGTMDKSIHQEVFERALAAIVVERGIDPQTWEGPRPDDQAVEEFASFSSVLGTFEYWGAD